MDKRLIDPFLDSTKSIIKDMTGIEIVSMSEPKTVNGDFFLWEFPRQLHFQVR
jgi:CheY-specific phosphatase CheX